MRLLRLVAPGDFAVDLHPYVTVVAGCTPEQRDALLAAFEAAVRGRTTDVGGVIEVHDVLLDLDEPTLELLELSGVSVDVVVRPGDLPGAGTAEQEVVDGAGSPDLAALEEIVEHHRSRLLEAEDAATAARAELDERRSQLASGEPAERDDPELQRLEAGVAAAEQSLAAAVDAVARAEADLGSAQEQLDALRSAVPDADDDDALAVLEARRDELTRALDPESGADFGVALAEVQRLEAEITQRDTDPGSGTGRAADTGSEPEPLPIDVEARMAEIQGVLALHASFAARQVSDALDALRLTPAGGELVPSPEAIALIDQLRQLDRRIAVLSEQADDTPDPSEVDRVRGELDEVRAAIRDAEQATAPSTVAADAAELEAAHEEVVEAREALETRFGRARAQQRYEAAVAAEEAVLDRLGIRSYTDFMTGGRAALYTNAEPEELRELRAKERELELELRDLERRRERAAELASVEDERRAARRRAYVLLDDDDVADDDLAHALFTLRVPAERATPYDELVDALEAVGLPVRDLGASTEDLEAMAAEWLDEYERAEGRRSTLEAELAVLQQEVGDAGAHALGPAAASVDEVSPADDATGRAPSLDEAHAAVRAAQERMVAHESTLRELAELDQRFEELEAAQRERRAAQQRLDDAEQAVADRRAEVERAEREREQAEEAVAAARAELEQRSQQPTSPPQDLEVAISAAEEAVAAADAVVDAARRDAEDAERVLEAATADPDPEHQRDRSASPPLTAPVEEIEWYLLARLAGQRQVSFAGSVPLVLDDALASVDDDGLVHLLDRLERMAGAVQVVHLSDDERVHGWAESIGPDRAAVVRPGPADDEVPSAS